MFNAILELKNILSDDVKEERLRKGFLKGGFRKRIVLREIKKLW